MSHLARPPADAALVVDLARIVGAQHVSSLDADRIAYSHDCWPRDVMRLRANEVPSVPHCIVWPQTPEDVARVLKLAEEVQVPIVPYGAGSGVCGGARPSEGGIVLDLKRMRAVRFLDAENLRMEVEAGIMGERLERYLNKRGFTLGHFPSSIVCSTVGGWLAARSAGQMSTRYGKIEDMAYGLEVVTAGHVRRMMLGPRPVEGPDFNALVIGSEGTLGAITAAELRLRPLPASRKMIGLRFENVAAGVEAIRRVLRAGLRPAVVRLYDALDTLLGRGHGKDDDLDDDVGSIDQIAGRAQGFFDDLAGRIPKIGKPGLTRRLSGALRRGTVRAVMGAPLVLNRAIDVLPDDSLLILGFEGQPALVAAELEAAKAICLAEGARDLGPGPGEHWLANRYSMSFKQSKVYASGLFVDTMEVASTWDRLMPMYKAVRRAIARDAVVMAHFSHAYGEGCSIYFTFAGVCADPSDPGDALARYDRIWKQALIAVHETGGTISHHHGVGESKAAGMAREHGPGGMRMLSALKDAFDPTGIMNPNKLGLEPQPRRPPPRRASSVDHAPSGFPQKIVAAVGEKNLMTSGSRTTVRPPDESALAAVLRVAHPRGIPVVTDQTGFRAPQGAVQLDLSRLEGVTRLSEHSLFVEVEAGVVVERLERLLGAHDLTMGAVHPRSMMRSVGAAVSRNLLVRRGVAFGDLADLCFAARGLLANGAPIETRPVPRSATGPELDRSLVGAFGRFGVITKVTLRVAARPKHAKTLAYVMPSIEAATECARLILQRGVALAAGRVYANGARGVLLLSLVAHEEAILRAQQTIVSSAVAQTEGEPFETKSTPLGGRFDAVVEAAVLWTRAVETLEAVTAVAGGDAWMDFLTPEGCTVVARVVDRETRYATVKAAADVGARIVAGARTGAGDPENFSIAVGDSWRDIPIADPARRTATFDDIRERLAELLDPTGVFRPREVSEE